MTEKNLEVLKEMLQQSKEDLIALKKEEFSEGAIAIVKQEIAALSWAIEELGKARMEELDESRVIAILRPLFVNSMFMGGDFQPYYNSNLNPEVIAKAICSQFGVVRLDEETVLKILDEHIPDMPQAKHVRAAAKAIIKEFGGKG